MCPSLVYVFLFNKIIISTGMFLKCQQLYRLRVHRLFFDNTLCYRGFSQYGKPMLCFPLSSLLLCRIFWVSVYGLTELKIYPETTVFWFCKRQVLFATSSARALLLENIGNVFSGLAHVIYLCIVKKSSIVKTEFGFPSSSSHLHIY